MAGTRRARRQTGAAWAWALPLLALVAGCAGSRTRPAVYPTDRVTAVVTAAGPVEVRDRYYPGQGVLRQAVLADEDPKAPPPRPKPPKRPDGTVGFDLLALSGGGSNGAFGAGVLSGWTARGDRPRFQVVTGISTGALLSSFAFAGPKFDGRLHDVFTQVDNAQIFRRNPVVALPWSESLLRTDPLAELIGRQVDIELLEAVAEADRQGRRLYVGSTHLDQKRLVIWDLGSIAACGHPGAPELYRKALLASASIPVVFNPVEFQVIAGGRTQSELHVDGGARSQVFLRRVLVQNLERGADPAAHQADPDAAGPDGADAPEVDPDADALAEAMPPPAAATARGRSLAGSRLYVIVNGKLKADPTPAARDLKSIAEESLSAMMYAKASGDLYRMGVLAAETGMDFRVLAVPQDMPDVPSPTQFDRTRMGRLFAAGNEIGRRGGPWDHTPHDSGDADVVFIPKPPRSRPRRNPAPVRDQDPDLDTDSEASPRLLADTPARWRPAPRPATGEADADVRQAGTTGKR